MTATIPTLPATISDTTYSVPGGTTRPCTDTGEFEAALTACDNGDVIVLTAGNTFTGNFTLPTKGAGDPIYIISSALANLPEGTRVGPSDTANMPKITSGAASINPALIIESDASGATAEVRLAGLEIASDYAVRTATCYSVLRVGWRSAYSATPEVLLTDSFVGKVVVDRCYIHGTLTGNVRDGVVTYAVDEFALLDSYIDDIHAAGAEAKGVWLYTGTGPMLVRNNFIQAAGICLFIYDSPSSKFYFTGGDNNGGADPVLGDTVTDTVDGGTGPILYYRLDSGTWSGGDAAGIIGPRSTYDFTEGNALSFSSGATATCGEVLNSHGIPNSSPIPSDVTISGNEITKKIIWYSGQPGYDGYAWTCKFMVEFKGASRVLFEGNSVSNSWYAADAGWWFVLTAKGNYITDITCRKNYAYNVSEGVNIAASFLYMRRVMVDNNIVYDQNNASNKFIVTNAGETDLLRDVTISHNTFIEAAAGSNGSIFFNGSVGTTDQITRLDFNNNIIEDGTGSAGGIAGNGVTAGYAAVAHYSSDHDFHTNGVIGTRGFIYANNTDYTGFTLKDEHSDVGFTDTTFDDITDFKLLDSSDWYQAGTSDKDLGADVDAVIAALAGESSSETSTKFFTFGVGNQIFAVRS